ncbi:hypothetical protein D3C72_1578130 [compost metagenome]
MDLGKDVVPMEKKHRNEITAFVIGNNVYRVIGTTHGIKQLKERGVDEYHIASTCLAMGSKLNEYNNCGKQVMLIDEGKNIATVIAIENYTIVVITVIDKSNVYAKLNTIIENVNEKRLQYA